MMSVGEKSIGGGSCSKRKALVACGCTQLIDNLRPNSLCYEFDLQCSFSCLEIFVLFTITVRMSGLEVAGLVIGIIGLVAVIKEANLQVKKLQQRRRIQTFGFSGGDTASLAKELQSSQLALTSRYNGFYDAYGRPFAQGDGTKQIVKIIAEN